MSDHKDSSFTDIHQINQIDNGNQEAVLSPPSDFLVRLSTDISAAGGELQLDKERIGSIGATMFDLPNSEDGTVTVLLSQSDMHALKSQAMCRIKSQDGRRYIGIVTSGPFAEPDSLRGDSHMLVTVATRGGIYLPPYHGRVQVALLGEELEDGALSPPRVRPLPNSPVFALDAAESAAVLRTDGDIRLGLVVGYDDVVVKVPSDQKAVLPRHTAVLGTTGGGKSTTIARLMQEAQQANMAVVILDVEPEYTFLHEKTDDEKMLAGLKDRNLAGDGLKTSHTQLFHLIGRETANPDHPNRHQFYLQFARLSPHAVIEILGLTEAQQARFLTAYDIAKALLRDLGIFPAKGNSEQERLAFEYDEFERGYPRLTLPLLMDVVGACLANASNVETNPYSPILKSSEAKQKLVQLIKTFDPPKNIVSWRALLGRLARLNRVKVFDPPDPSSHPINYKALLRPGMVSVFDLSDSGTSELTNLVISDLLRGIQEAQEDAYLSYEKAQREGTDPIAPTKTLIVVEEAHEFLSADRIDKMPTLFQQVARIAKRGRKRWLGLVFVTQLPQHLPRQVFGLVNSYVLHKVTDPQVVSSLKRTVSGIDESLWRQLPGLAPGQAIVSFPHMTRPLMVSIDPTSAKLRMVD